MPSLNDEIMDAAEELATLQLLSKNAPLEEIVKAVSVTVNENISPNSLGGRLAEACFRRKAELVMIQNVTLQAHEAA